MPCRTVEWRRRVLLLGSAAPDCPQIGAFGPFDHRCYLPLMSLELLSRGQHGGHAATALPLGDPEAVCGPISVPLDISPVRVPGGLLGRGAEGRVSARDRPATREVDRATGQPTRV
jgi:hypothetical protein